MKQCWECQGRRWVSDGDIDDGMMTGRMKCPTCDGTGEVTANRVLLEIRKLTLLPDIGAGAKEL